MKKVFLIIILFSSIFGLLSAQSKIKSNLTIEKAAPMLYLNGTSAGIDFYNGDITLTQSSNTLTLAGGNLALGTNSITMTGALGATGGRILKGWFTDLEVTNTIIGTASMVTGFTRNSGTLSLSGGHGITLTTTGLTSLTLPTSGTLAINPMTTAGDLVIGGVSGIPTRLAAGTDGYTLTMIGGVPAWGVPAGGGGAMIYPLEGIPLSTGTSWGTSIVNNSVQWDSAYVGRLRWDGGATGLVAATGRASLGGTTIGQNIFTLTNPDAIRFLRINADNTVTALSAANFKTALSLTASDVSLGNVTNESKATMFTSPTFTTSVNLAATTYVPSGGTINFNTSGEYMAYNATDDDLYIGNMGVQLITGTLGKELAPVSKGWFTDLDVNNTITGSISGNAATVTGFTRNSGALTLSGGHGLTFATTGITSLTLPTSGTLAINPMTTAGDLVVGGASGAPTRLAAGTNGHVLTLSAGSPVWAAPVGGETLEARVDSIVAVLKDSIDIEALMQIDFDTDTVADLSELRLKANIASPTFTGTVTMPTPFTLGATSVTASGAELNLLDGVTSIETYSTENYGSTGTGDIVLSTGATVANMTIDDVSPTELGYLDGIVSPIKQASDTIPIFVFGLGSGVAADTAVFNDNAIAGSFYNAGSDTLKITSLMGVLAEGSGTETIAVQVSWHSTFKSGSATNLNSSALTVNSITTGTSDTSFANDKIPPGVFVWCTLSGTSAGNKPSLLILTMSGYKIPRY